MDRNIVNENQKRTKISKTLIGRIASASILLNIIAIFVISFNISKIFYQQESDYLSEISLNITSTIEMKFDEFLAINTVLSKNDTIIQLLEESDKDNPMHENEKADIVIEQMNKIAMEYQSEIYFVGIFDLEQDGYLMHDGDFSDDTFSFKEWDYYEPINTRTACITEPYLDTEINEWVVSVCYPVFSNSGNVLGITLVDLSIGFMETLVKNTQFGETGSSFIIGDDNSILAHTDSSKIGQNFSALNLVGSEITQELNNSTNTLVEFTQSGLNKIGLTRDIGDYGWKIVTSINYSEFTEEIIIILTILFFMLLASTMCTLVLIAVTVATSLKPLKEIQTAMHQLSDGNIHYECGYHSSNEIGELADDLRYTMSNLRSYIEEIKRQLNSFSLGDFTVTNEIEFLGDFKEIQTSTGDFVELITETLEELKASIEQVSTGTEYVANGSQELAHGSIQQAESVSVLTDTIDDISNSVTENVKNVEYVNTQSKQACSELSVSNTKMNKMVQAMGDIQKSSGAIQNIIKVIEEVAFQTDILALNAAVEASRAGQAGKGFAIVADEVRSLSARTSEAVEETVRLIEESTTAVNVGSQLVEETSTSLNNAIEVVNGYIDTLDKVTDTSKGQAVSISGINTSVHEITSVTQNNSSISEESAAASEELSSQATIMRDSIGRFKLH